MSCVSLNISSVIMNTLVRRMAAAAAVNITRPLPAELGAVVAPQWWYLRSTITAAFVEIQ